MKKTTIQNAFLQAGINVIVTYIRPKFDGPNSPGYWIVRSADEASNEAFLSKAYQILENELGLTAYDYESAEDNTFCIEVTY